MSLVEDVSQPAPSPPIPLSRNTDYLLLWGGQTVSAVGSQVSRLALPLLILAVTNSPAQAGLAGAFNTVPYVFLGLIAGALADRWNRRLVMLVCDTGRTIALGSIPLAAALGHISVWQVYIVALISGTLNVFFDCAEIASLPRVVAPDQLSTAMAQNNATFGASSLLGQPLGGALYQFGRTIPFLADAISYAVSVISLFFIRTPLQAERSTAPQRLRDDIRDGIVWLWHQPLIRFLAFLNAGNWIVLSGNYLLVIVLAKHQHASPTTIGFLFAVNGICGMVGSITGSWFQKRWGFTRVVIVSIWLWAVLWPLYALAPNPVAIAAISAAIFFVFPVYNVVQMSYRMLMIPDELQGRVNSVFRIIAFSGQPIGMVLIGALLQSVGGRITILLGCAILVLLALIVTLNREVRHPVDQTRATRA